ncbi:SDR family NAD(P)-dependent oxidoreductase [Sciscionella marina]|uniref:SDR family NAD(P)-dependent oxidoreductase n=1 Tax=Sciscionella marina TaxID=508770 RepID=UPI000477E66A|nr:SDR family NAD(P)-dependent oxidoreductase [Sciscionella marina]
MGRQASVVGKVALVTGAARGVGRATAGALARAGAKVALVDLNGADVEKAAAEIGTGAIGLPLDVLDHTAFARVFDEVEQRLGPVDILINNAGIMPIGPFEEESDATAARVLGINLHAVLWSSKEAVRRLKRRGGKGHIVNVSSGAGWVAGGGGATYSGSKHGVVGFSHALSLELHGTGINVSVVGPAVVKTDLGAGLADVKGLSKVTPDEVANAIVDGLRKPRFVIWVPKVMGVMSLAMCGMPYRLRDFLARLTNADKLLLQADTKARAAYEESVAGKPEDGGDLEANSRVKAHSKD